MRFVHLTPVRNVNSMLGDVTKDMHARTCARDSPYFNSFEQHQNMNAFCMICRTLGRQLVLKKGVLLITSLLLVLLMLAAYSFMQYSVALQVMIVLI